MENIYHFPGLGGRLLGRARKRFFFLFFSFFFFFVILIIIITVRLLPGAAVTSLLRYSIIILCRH